MVGVVVGVVVVVGAVVVIVVVVRVGGDDLGVVQVDRERGE